jgi:hypothetical protein
MCINRHIPTLGFDISCLVTTVMQVMFKNYETYVTKEHVTHQVKVIRSGYPIVSDMLLKLLLHAYFSIEINISNIYNRIPLSILLFMPFFEQKLKTSYIIRKYQTDYAQSHSGSEAIRGKHINCGTLWKKNL